MHQAQSRISLHQDLKKNSNDQSEYRKSFLSKLVGQMDGKDESELKRISTFQTLKSF